MIESKSTFKPSHFYDFFNVTVNDQKWKPIKFGQRGSGHVDVYHVSILIDSIDYELCKITLSYTSPDYKKTSDLHIEYRTFHETHRSASRDEIGLTFYVNVVKNHIKIQILFTDLSKKLILLD